MLVLLALLPLGSSVNIASMDLYDAVIDTESSGDPLARSARGARGLMQITPPVLFDYNARMGTRYSEKDLDNPEVNSSIGKWYLGTEVPRLLKHFGVDDTLDNRLWAYNAGIGRVVKGQMPTETKDYIGKVRGRMGRR